VKWTGLLPQRDVPVQTASLWGRVTKLLRLVVYLKIGRDVSRALGGEHLEAWIAFGAELGPWVCTRRRLYWIPAGPVSGEGMT
jgi:hypothetical protein